MKLSIITINYNNSKGLEKTIKSVISQDFKDYEYIVIDGGSSDGSVDVIKKYADKIDFWVSEPDKGIYNAMNKGVRQAQGEYINFMNSGDCFNSCNVLQEINGKLIDEDIIIGKCCNAETKQIYSTLEPGQSITLMTLIKEVINHQSTFYKHRIFDKYKYDENLKIMADRKLNIILMVLNNCSIKLVDTLVANYDMTGISSTNSELFSKERKHVLEELIPSRILEDYKPLIYADDQMIKYVAKISKTYRLHKITLFILRMICKLIK